MTGGCSRRRTQCVGHRERHATPVRFFHLKLPLANARQAIELCAAARVGLAPLRADEAAFFEAVERRKERPGLHIERAVGDLADAAGDPKSVQRVGHQAAKNQQVEGPAQQIGSRFQGQPPLDFL